VLPIAFIILNNRRYAALQDFAPVFGFAEGEAVAGTELPAIDFVALAKSMGFAATRVGEPAASRQKAVKCAVPRTPNTVERAAATLIIYARQPSFSLAQS